MRPVGAMEPELEASRRVGTTLLNKWTLERLIGTGGMAAVYVAVHKIGRREAIKILYSEIAQDPDLRARFEQEAHAVNRFKHPGAVEIRDIDVAEDGAPFLVMELLEGRPLSDVARDPGGVDLETLLRIADELLDVLVAAHAQGIIHRDIKPDNLFVLNDGRIKVLDFGIARVRAGASSKMRTRVGATLGTAPYMPPEQIKGLEIDGRADLFAVGATMFRLIAKRRIHEAASDTELLLKMATVPAPPLCSVAPGVPPFVGLVIDRALSFDRERRYPDAATMQADVRAVRGGKPPPFASSRPADPGRDERSTRPAPVASSLAEAPTMVPRRSLDSQTTAPALVSVVVQPSPDPTHTATPNTFAPSAAAAPPTISAAQIAALPPPRPVDVAPSARAGGDPMQTLPASVPFPLNAYAATPEQTKRSTFAADGTAQPPPASVPPTSIGVPSEAPRSQPRRPVVPESAVPIVKPSNASASGPKVGLLPLVLVGVVFAGLGVALTLWFSLGARPVDDGVSRADAGSLSVATGRGVPFPRPPVPSSRPVTPASAPSPSPRPPNLADPQQHRPTHR